MESITKPIYLKHYLIILCSLIFMNFYESKAEGEISKTNKVEEIDFVRALNQNSVQFHEYENPKNLFDDFFGLTDPLNESPFKTNFQDLSLQIDSKNVRKIYKEKLLEMTKKIKKDEKDKNNWFFFSGRI